MNGDIINGRMMLFDQKQNPPMAIIRAAATPLMRKARALSRPILGADSQTTIAGRADRRGDKREQSALLRGQPWACGAERLADRP